MPISRVLSLLLLLGTFFLTFSAQAEPLKSAEIKSFIASLGELQALGEQYDDLEEWTRENKSGSGKEPGAEVNWMADAVVAMKGHPIYDDFEEVVEAHGFSSPEQWGRVGDRVLKAYFAASMDQQAPAMQAQMEQAMRDLENSPDLTAEQKQMMKQSMASSIALVKSMSDAPAADIKAIKPHMAELQRAFGDQ